MRFQVPQFIEVEDKIFGPLTLKQFLYLAGGGAAIFLLYILLPFFIFIFFAAPVGAFSAALAFYKINNQPFVKTVENAFHFFTRNKVYTWKKQEKVIKRTLAPDQGKNQAPAPPALSKHRLDDLAWSLDIQQKTKE